MYFGVNCPFKLTKRLFLLLFAGRTVTSNAHHTVSSTPQTASTSLEEAAGPCSGILCVFFGIFSCKKKEQ